MANGDILFQAFPLADWPWGGDTASLYIFDAGQWTDQNGMVHLDNVGESLIDPVQICPILINGRGAVVQDFYYQPTTSSIDRPNARRTGVLVDQYGDIKYDKLFVGARFPTLPNPMTWPEFVRNNYRAHCRSRLPDRYLDADAIEDRLDNITSITPQDLARLISACGTAVMVDGAVVVPSVLVTANSLIKAWSMSAGVARAALWVDPEESNVGVNFTVHSSDPGDNGLIGWEIREPF